MVELGTIGFVGVDLCRSPADRGRILAMQYSDKVLHRESALWVHTGFHTSVLTTRIDVARDVPVADVVVIGGRDEESTGAEPVRASGTYSTSSASLPRRGEAASERAAHTVRQRAITNRKPMSTSATSGLTTRG